MSSLDSLLPPEGSGNHPGNSDDLIARAEEVASTLLAPNAEATDRAPLVPRENIAAIATAGLLGLSGPVEFGGQGAPGTVSRRIAEILGGACGVTHFTQAQHHGPVGMIATSDNNVLKDRYLRRMCEGRALAGVAFSHLRRAGSPALAATPVRGGFGVSGEAPWVTSWGLASLFVIAASLPEDRILYFCHDGIPTDCFRPSPPISLAVMNASSTVRVRFDSLFIPEESVVRIADAASWRMRDRINTAHVNPAVFGIARTCIDGMKEQAATSGSELVAQSAAALDEELSQCRSEAYGWADINICESDVPQLLSVKTWSLDLVARAAHAYVATVGGRAMGCDHRAQRLMREAIFYTIQAQTGAVRDATLDRLAFPGRDERSIGLSGRIANE